MNRPTRTYNNSNRKAPSHVGEGWGGVIGEVCSSMSRNKLRVALTGFSIAFGIFMLIVLLAAGNGLMGGMRANFGDNSNNMQVWGGWTSKEWHGRAKSRHIQLNARRFEAVQKYYEDIIVDYVPCIDRGVTISVGHQNRSVTLCGTRPPLLEIAEKKIVAGRWLNEIDEAQRRKVAVMDNQTAEVLFRDLDLDADFDSDFDSDSDSDSDFDSDYGKGQGQGQSQSRGQGQSQSQCQSSKSRSKFDKCIGEWIKVNGLMFRLVGIYENSNNHGREQNTYCPFATMAAIYSGSEEDLSTIHLSLHGLETAEANADFEEKLNRTMAYVEDYDPTDHGIWVWNKAEDYLTTMKMMRGLRVFIWIIGIASLFAGVVGISNIMLITVRERTREFGIRKAIGARPRSIVTLVLTESVAITLLFGYIGLLLGIGLTQLINNTIVAADTSEHPVFRDMTVDMGAVLAATAVMVIAGLIAGYVPANRAARIKPVIALAAN